MAKRLFSVPQPLTGDEDYLFVSFCIPDTPDWRRLIVGWVETLSYGRAYDEQTGYIKDAQAVGREIFESMSMCKMTDLLKLFRMQIAAIVGEAVDLTDEENLIPTAVDYTETGLAPTLQALFNVDRAIYPDMNVAETLFEGLIGRKVDIGFPFDGTGLADITDEQLDVLHNRLRMTDSSLFNPFSGEKNVVEALETLFRRDSLPDLEILPNIATILEKSLNIGGTDGPVIGLLKSLVGAIATQLNWPPAAVDMLKTKLDEEKQLSIADILLLLAQAMQEFGGIEPQTNIQINNQTVCGNGDCSDGDDDNITIELNDEGASVIEDGLNGSQSG